VNIGILKNASWIKYQRPERGKRWHFFKKKEERTELEKTVSANGSQRNRGETRTGIPTFDCVCNS